jgi:hypothetical protein
MSLYVAGYAVPAIEDRPATAGHLSALVEPREARRLVGHIDASCGIAPDIHGPGQMAPGVKRLACRRKGLDPVILTVGDQNTAIG